MGGSRLTLKKGHSDQRIPTFSVAIGDLERPHVFSGDVWEALHRATGLPIVADYFTRMHRLDQVTVTDKTLFEALCSASDAIGVRWTKDGDFLLCRSTSYLWDKLKEVPGRYLQKWMAHRDPNGELPLTDVLEMASLPDAQLGSDIVAEAIRHCWGLPEWRFPHFPDYRRKLRFLSTLTPDQLRRALEPTRLPFHDLTAEQQQAVMDLGGDPRILQLTPEQRANAYVYAGYVPPGRYVWDKGLLGFGAPVAAGRTADEALAAARRLSSQASSQQVHFNPLGYFAAGVTFHLLRLAKP